jgi:UDP:flavonoid glycosyltransferase YjiC (YdhE family)
MDLARILLTTFGSYGDLHPYIAIGIELRSRGHQVTLATSEVYRAKVEAEGLSFHPVRPDITLNDQEQLGYVFDRKHGSERVLRYIAEHTREGYEDILPAAKQADVIVTHIITYGAILAAEKLGMPWISSLLAPCSILSAYDPPAPAPAPWVPKLRMFGVGFMRWFWGLGRRQVLAWVQPLLDLRREIGLPPGEHPVFEGANSPTLALALFSRYLAEPQPDWPPQMVTTGFPFYDRDLGHENLPPELDRFLADGPPPVVFTLGSSAVGAAGDFYLQSLAAVERLGCRAVLLTGSIPQVLPRTLPPGVIAVAYAPHSAVFPRAAVNVHQGGIGTLAQALRAGKPMLVVPFAHDQFDNALRARRHGGGEVLPREHYNTARAGRQLRRLLERPAYAAAAAAVGEKVREENGASSAADAIEKSLRA